MRIAVAIATLLFTSACVIVEEGKEKEPVPVPTPVPVPGGGSGGSGGSGGGSGGAGGGDAEPKPFPGSGLGTDPGTDVLWLVRLERNTANLATHYESLVSDFGANLTQKGLKVRATAVASLYDGRLLWASVPGANAPVSLNEALRYHAARAAAPSGVCTTQALLNLGQQLSSAQVDYPTDLLKGRTVPAAARRPFFLPAGAFVVGMLDSGARPVALQSSTCTSGGDPAYRLGADPASWLRLAGGVSLSRARVRLAFLSTAEGISSDELRTKCLSTPNFPALALDALSPSPQPFFNPLLDKLNAQAAGLASANDLCDALGGDFPTWAGAFAERWVEGLKKLPVK